MSCLCCTKVYLTPCPFPQIALVKAKALGYLGTAEAEAQALELLAALGQGSPEALEALGHLHFKVGRVEKIYIYIKSTCEM